MTSYLCSDTLSLKQCIFLSLGQYIFFDHIVGGSEGGVVRPRVFAVFGLMMTNLKFAGCATGRSAGLLIFLPRRKYLEIPLHKIVLVTDKTANFNEFA